MGERPDHVAGLIWRKDAPAALGRANPAGYQVLYLADRIDTALQETHIVDDAVVISEFSIQHHHSVRIAPIGEFMQIQRTGRGFLSGEYSGAVSSMLNACEPTEAKSLIITDAFLYECLTAHDDYEISSHVALCVFEKNPQVSTVAYTSRRHTGALCFAVKVDEFWRNWCLVAVRQAQAQHLACGMYRLGEVMGVDGILADGTLLWSDQGLAENERPELEPPFTPVSPE
ncbi:RES family NAD+ phosphorylase [Bradyrhizobium sp. CSA207]|uniref:RES family NAD+ phosphorylase n=1 Tax=Bradyrhizobium sp. CSA207 TaxID=2698826 RepID=UPI0023B12111|nr:RES family NAD+ phosphorylase [Bradyrhizobium sp. CSA207]